MEQDSFSQLISQIPVNSTDAILSSLSILPEELRNFLQSNLKKEDTFLADPVFEPMFGYKTDSKTFGELTDLMERSFINGLNNAKAYRFSKDMHPYIHQTAAWRTLLKTKNSLVISSGTGSGKTECFMMPIISDLVRQVEENHNVLEGVQALFIYPLNALIQNQKERFNEWTKAYHGKIRFCLYNGLLPSQIKQTDNNQNTSEILDRKRLYNSPSPLLITNTTMLEYMLIRACDKSILEKSKGKLRYIVLDEAHTYLGSQAAELSLLLKRVTNAFDVSPQNVQFIATSATIGSTDATDQLRRFLSSVAGISEDQVSVVFGQNEIEKIQAVSQTKTLEELERINDNDELMHQLRQQKLACSLRDFFINETYTAPKARTLHEISAHFKLEETEVCRWLDLLSRQPEQEKSFLPLRLHLFHKTFPGIWVCCNPDCQCKDNIQNWNYGKIYFKERCTCDCGAPVFRLIACRNCGHPILEARFKQNNKNGKKYLYQNFLNDIDEFSLEDDDEVGVTSTSNVYVDNSIKPNCYLNMADSSVSTEKQDDNISIPLGIFEEKEDIHCCDEAEYQRCFRPIQGAPFFLSNILPILLDHAEKGDTSPQLHPHDAQKMICFTDSRQGTARLAAKLQQNAERNCFRSILLHAVASLEQTKPIITPAQIQQLKQQLKQLGLLSLLPTSTTSDGAVKYDDLINYILKNFNGSDLEWIYKYYAEKDPVFAGDQGRRNLIEILFARELARRPKNAVNMETLGLLSISYDLHSITMVPNAIGKYFTNVEEWKDFLKIILDFYIRADGYITYPANWAKWGAIRHGTRRLPPNEWPKVVNKKTNIIRLLGYTLNLQLDNDFHRDIVNQIMDCAWQALTAKTGILTPAVNQTYAMDLNKIRLMRPKKIYRCSKTNKALDVVLRGISPYATSKNMPKCESFDITPYDFSSENGLSYAECVSHRLNWLQMSSEIANLKKAGIWSNIANSIILGNRYFRTAEHSAQQAHELLSRYERFFKDGDINVLNCSTTMEMGVDIGGITIATMNNVPPHPANYLQRAGRAGRRKETKSISFTLCKDNSHDQYVFEHPTWAFNAKINAPYVDKYSFTVLQRHVNALLLSYFFEIKNASIKDGTTISMEWFMLPEGKNELSHFENFCKDVLRTNDYPDIKGAVQKLLKNTHYEAVNIESFVEPLCELIEKTQKQWFAEYKAIQEQKTKEKNNGNKIAVSALEKSEKRLCREYALKEFIAYGLLPRFGFPINIVTFDTNKRETNRPETARDDNLFKRRELPSRDIVTALREYAPGSEVVIDGLVYKSAGITLNWHIPASDSETKEIQSIRYMWHCSKCGASGTSPIYGDTYCTVCGEHIEHTEKYITPAGFTVDYNAPVNNNVSNQSHFINIYDPLVTAHNNLNNFIGLPYIKYKNDSDGSVVYYSKGSGGGYCLCLECGRMEDGQNSKKFAQHKRLKSGSDCIHSSFSIVNNINLGAEIKTDVLELLLSDLNGKMIDDRTQAYSLAVAIRSGIAKFMNIEMDEIGCITKEIRRVGTNIKGYAIVLFDRNATGYCSSGLIINNLAQIFTYARELLNCDCKQACNKCLLQNDTKYNYQDLDRNKALEFLTEEWIEKNTLPSNMKIFGESSSVLTTSLENVIEDIKGISEIFFIIPDASDNDDFTASPIYRLINRLSMANILTNLCFNSEAISSDTREVLSALGKHPSIHFKSRPQNLNPSIMAIVHTGDRYYGYGSLDETVQHLDSNWGSACNTSVITGRFDAQTVIFEDYKLEKYSEQNYDKIYEFTSELNDSGLKFGKHLLDILHFNIDPYIQETKIKSITYKDRYLKNPLSTGLLFSFIKELKDRYSKKWACCEITIDVAAYNEDKSPIPQMCYHDWTSIDEQKKVYSEIFQTIDLKCYLREHNKKYLEHTRIMEIILENSSIIQIILDQGFSYWRCLPYHYQDNFFPFLQDEHIQAEHIINKLPPITGDVFPTRIFCRIIK